MLSAEGKALMMRPASAASPFYGLGWFVDSGNGTVWHSGTSPGYRNARDDDPRREEGGRRAGQRGQRSWASERRPSSATASPPGRWASTTTAKGPACPRRPCSSRLVLLPFIYLLSMIWAWRHRVALRAKSERAFGLFSLWFPLLTTLVAAWVILQPGAEPVRRTARHHQPVPARPRSGAHRYRGDRCAVGSVQARGGLHRQIWSCPASESHWWRPDVALSAADCPPLVRPFIVLHESASVTPRLELPGTGWLPGRPRSISCQRIASCGVRWSIIHESGGSPGGL